MKIRSVLTAISVLAFITGTAHANPLGFNIVNADGIADNSQEALMNIALEHNDMNTGPVWIEFEIFDVAGAEFPSNDNLDIVVTLPSGMTFATPGANSTDIVDGTNGSVQGASLTSGGAAGDMSARYVVGLDDDASDSNFTIGFRIPVHIDMSVCIAGDKEDLSYYDLKVEVAVLNQGGAPLSGTPIFGQTVQGSNARVVKCVDGIVADVNSDEDVNDSIIALSDYNSFLPAFGVVPIDDTSQLTPFLGQGVTKFDQAQTALTPIGTIDYTMNTNAIIKLAATTGTNNLLDDTDLASLGYTVQWEDVTGMSATGAQLAGVTGVQLIPNNAGTNAANFSYNAAARFFALNGTSTILYAVSDILAEIEEQSVSVTDSFVTFTTASMGVAEGNDDLCGNGDLDALERQGRRFGFFDWIGEDKAVKDVFRITGLTTLPDGTSPGDIEVDLIFKNSRGGPAFDGQYRLTIPAPDIQNGVATIRSTDFDAINPGYDQSDVLILVQNTSRDIDVDRLQVDRTGALNDYGDGANLGFNLFGEVTPSGDADDELYSE